MEKSQKDRKWNRGFLREFVWYDTIGRIPIRVIILIIVVIGIIAVLIYIGRQVAPLES